MVRKPVELEKFLSDTAKMVDKGLLVRDSKPVDKETLVFELIDALDLKMIDLI